VRESKRHAKNEWLAASLWCSTMYVCLVIAACAWLEKFRWSSSNGIGAAISSQPWTLNSCPQECGLGNASVSKVPAT
jgi:hypothetical protein